jgi:ribosome-binding protein aMBF1 (putative translation factor)
MTIAWEIDIYDSKAEPCETCGPAYEEFRVTREGSEYEVCISVGCTGGTSFETPHVEDVVDAIDQWAHLSPTEAEKMKQAILRDAQVA